MRKVNYKSRCTKRKLSKCKEVCRTYDEIQMKVADMLQATDDIKAFRCNVCLEGVLVVDEIQNVMNSKNGSIVVGMLTQLINNAGISICMVGTPKSALFFGQEMMLARRSLGLSYGPFACNEMFADFCAELYRYQYVQNKTVLDDSYNHSRGNISIVVGLLHDA